MDLKEDFKRIQGAGLSGLCFAFVVAATPLLSGCSPELARHVVRQSVGAGTVGPREAARRELRGALGFPATVRPEPVLIFRGQGPATDMLNRLFSVNSIPWLSNGRGMVDPSPYREDPNGQGAPLDSYSTPVPLRRRFEY
ncbi:MAG: hypothetical protein JNL76_04690 [Alphaproteobacteria bacterium]|nr:hypothetical protein [Alphaproteobacteria bacterium]